jgi:hypothetical protein
MTLGCAWHSVVLKGQIFRCVRPPAGDLNEVCQCGLRRADPVHAARLREWARLCRAAEPMRQHPAADRAAVHAAGAGPRHRQPELRHADHAAGDRGRRARALRRDRVHPLADLPDHGEHLRAPAQSARPSGRRDGRAGAGLGATTSATSSRARRSRRRWKRPGRRSSSPCCSPSIRSTASSAWSRC